MGLCQRPCYSAIRIGRKTHLAAPAAFRGIHAHSADRSALAGSQGTSLRGTVGAGQLQTTPLSPFRRMRIEHFQRRDDRTSRCTIGNRSVRCQATSRQGQRPTKRCPFAFLSAIPSYSGHADEKLDSPRSQRRNYSVRTTEVYERRDAKSR